MARYLEIFNEQIHDLLVPPKVGPRDSLQARAGGNLRTWNEPGVAQLGHRSACLFTRGWLRWVLDTTGGSVSSYPRSGDPPCLPSVQLCAGQAFCVLGNPWSPLNVSFRQLLSQMINDLTQPSCSSIDEAEHHTILSSLVL